MYAHAHDLPAKLTVDDRPPRCQCARYGQGQGASAGETPPFTCAARAGRPAPERDGGMSRFFREQRDEEKRVRFPARIPRLNVLEPITFMFSGRADLKTS
jgi:hypothetical protein